MTAAGWAIRLTSSDLWTKSIAARCNYLENE